MCVLVIDMIVALAQHKGVDLIVMGTDGRTEFNHLMMGSQTEKGLRKTTCSVMTIKGK